MTCIRRPYSSPLLFFAFSLLAGMAFFVFPFVFADAQGGGGGMGGGSDDDKGGEARDPIFVPEPPLPDAPILEPPSPERMPPDSFPAPSVSPFCVNGTDSRAVILWDSAAYGTQGVHVQVDDDEDWGNGFWWDIAAPSENTREIPEDNGRPMNVAQPPFRRLVLNPGQNYRVRIYSLEWARVGPEVSFIAACGVPSEPLSLVCSASPAEPANPDTVTWLVSVSGGSGPFAYAWSGTDELSGNAALVSKTYTTTGVKEGTAVVIASDGSQETCTQSLFVWPPEGIVIEPFCAGAESKANISWRTAGSFGDSGFFVDVDNDTNWNNGFWNKFIPAGANSTIAPDGFNPFGGVSGRLLFDEGSHYYARVYYIAGVRHTSVDTFSALACLGSPPPSVSLFADGSDGSTSISYDTSAVLSWSAQEADSCTASGAWSGARPRDGSEPTGNLTSSKTYTLACAGPGGTAADTVTVHVGPPPSDITFNAVPSFISRGENTELVWSTANTISCAIDQGIGAVLRSGSKTVQPSQTTAYTITCGALGGGSVSKTAIVEVRAPPAFQEIKPR